MWNMPDLTGLFWFAVFGFCCAVVLGLGGLGGLIWFFTFHVKIV